MIKCMGCMRDYNETMNKCPSCGYSEKQMKMDILEYADALQPETILDKRFVIGRVLDLSDFSIIYLSWDALLERRVIIREYFPYGVAERNSEDASLRAINAKEQVKFEKGREVFEEENKALWKNQDIPELVNVYRCFEENGTSYSVSEYLEGCTLQDYIDVNAKLPEDEANNMFVKMLDALDTLHKRDICHLNLAPENIYMLGDDRFKFIDFGKAKETVHRLQNGQLAIFDERYTAPEVLNSGTISSAADMYSLGAIYYQMLTGDFPLKPGKKGRGGKKMKVKNGRSTMIIDLLTEEDINARPGNAEQLMKAIEGR